MNDLQELRAVLQAKADEVPPHHMVPPAMMRRARRRIARTAVVSSVIVLAMGIGAVAGVRAISGPPRRQIPGSPTPSALVGPQACRATELAAALRVEGAAGSQYLTVTFTNRSAAPCTMEGAPQVQVLDANGTPLPTQLGTQPAQWQGNATPTPPGWPVVTLPPGGSAISVMRWNDECDTQGATRFVLDLGGEQISLDHPGSPPCVTGPGATARLDVGPVEPTPVP